MFKLLLENLETRENPSGPALIDPTAPIAPPNMPPAYPVPIPTPTPPPPVGPPEPPPIDPFVNWG